jgi:metal-responsive CopG/Arc/MetJ family transcriptional regulator
MEEEAKTVSFRLPASLYRQLLEIAHRNMLSVSDVIRQALIEYTKKVRE